MKQVFVVMNAEFVHPGHIHIIKVARELGEVTVGLATDEFAARYKRLPVMSYEQRREVLENIRGVKRVIPQDTLDLKPVLRELKPDYFVHGDDWKTGRLAEVREEVIQVLGEWGGELIEPAYTQGISSTMIDAALRSRETTPGERRVRFRRLMAYQPLVRILEVQDRSSAVTAEQADVVRDGRQTQFDALWVSGLPGLLSKGQSSEGITGLGAFLDAVDEILDATNKPLIVELHYNAVKNRVDSVVRALERRGVAALVITIDGES